jgi:hypothetical protein
MRRKRRRAIIPAILTGPCAGQAAPIRRLNSPPSDDRGLGISLYGFFPGVDWSGSAKGGEVMEGCAAPLKSAPLSISRHVSTST